VSRATERSKITAILKRIDLTVRFNQTLLHLSVASCLVLGALVLIELAPRLVPVNVPPGSVIVGVGSAAFLAFLLWSQLGARQLGRAAGVADMRAGLNDEIKSAYWFMRQDDSSPWIDLLVGRAAATAHQLSPRRLVPVTIPKRFGIALALFGLLQVLALVPSGGPLLTFAVASDSIQFERALDTYAEEIRDLIDGEGDELLDEEALALLELALEELEAEDTSFDELLRDLREAQDVLDEGNLEMAATRDALDELGDEFSGSNELQDFVNALRNQDLGDAADRMRELAERLADLDSLELAELAGLLQQASNIDEPVIEELLEALQEAADAISEDRLPDAQEALNEAGDAIDQITDRQARQQANNEAAQRAQALQEALARQPMGAADQAQTAEGQSGEPQQANSSAAAPSSAVNRSEGEQPPGTQSGPAGNATGDPSGAPLELGASTTLEAQLALEVIDGATPDPDEERELDPKDLFQEASRQQGSIVQYRDVQAPSQYSQGSALNAERIPWQYRGLVKKYFLAIRPAPHRAPGRHLSGQNRPDDRK
jgi:hypothetical protein